MYKRNHIGNQQGVATLGITLMLLFIMTLVALYTAKTSIKEQQVSANQYRADQSLSTGNAALDWGVAYYSKSMGRFCNKDTTKANCLAAHGVCILDKTRAEIKTQDAKCVFIYNESDPLIIDPDSDGNSDGSDDALSIGTSEMYYAFVDGGVSKPYVEVSAGEDPDIYRKEISIYGIGHSDDDTGMRTVSMNVDTSNIFGEPGLGSSAFPLITKTMDNPNGNLMIVNRFDNRTIWSGSEQQLSGSTNTYILEDGLGWNCNNADEDTHAKCVSNDEKAGVPLYTMAASDGVDTVNADIIDADTNLANLDPAEFFENFFGKKKLDVEKIAKELGEGHWFEVDNKGDLINAEWADLNKPPLVWVKVPSGVTFAPSGGLSQLGEEELPLVLIVDGDLKIGGTGNEALQLVGVLYVTGTWDSSANMTMQGMMICEGGVVGQGSGTAKIIYDADLFSGKNGPEPGTIAAAVPNTWKDWE